MGILTTQDSARSFSTYVALFGLALLITSALYLRDLDHWAETHACVETVIENEKLQTDILCSNFNTWRAAAIIGIVIGVVDVLVVPFLLCCSICIVCGCTALICVCVDCESPSSDENTEDSTENRTTTTTRTTNESTNNDTEATITTTTIATTTDKPSNETLSKFSLKNLPKPVLTILNVLGWTVWVFLPLVGTLLITIWIYKTDAIRTHDDRLYRSALTVFVCALLNLMVFYQKFIDSVCKFVCRKICGRTVRKEKERRRSVVSEV